jgi:hypothetical protein
MELSRGTRPHPKLVITYTSERKRGIISFSTNFITREVSVEEQMWEIRELHFENEANVLQASAGRNEKNFKVMVMFFKMPVSFLVFVCISEFLIE